MSDLIDKQAAVTPDIVDEEFKLEIIEDPATPGKDEGTLALEARIAEMEAKQTQDQETIIALQAGASDATMATALAAELKKIQAPAPVVTKETEPVDYNKLFETVDKNFFTSPSKGVVEVITPIMQSMDEKYSGTLKAQAVTISKLTMLGDPTGQSDYVKYKGEIDQIVKDSPPSESVYADALRSVRANHFEEIMQEKVAAQIKVITDKAEAAILTPPPVQGQGPNFTNASQVQAAHAKKNAGRITAGQLATASKWAMQKGYDWADPEDQEFVIKFLKGEGAI